MYYIILFTNTKYHCSTPTISIVIIPSHYLLYYFKVQPIQYSIYSMEVDRIPYCLGKPTCLPAFYN